jgi:hypothetical protein
MDKGMFFLILGLACIWLVLDEFVGKARLTTMAGLMTPDLSLGKKVKTALGEAGATANDIAPGIFYDPNDPKDKQQDKEFKGLYEQFKENNPKGLY